MLGQNTQENCDFYLINEANKDDFGKDCLNFDYQFAIEEINFFSSYNLLEDDLTVSKSKEFAGNLQNKDRFSIDEEEIIECNFGNKETLASPVLKEVIATNSDKEINSQSISCLIESHKDEKFDEKSDISNEAQESENYEELAVSIASKKRRFGKKQDKALFDDLKKICNHSGLDISDFLNDYDLLNSELKEIISHLCDKCEWKGTIIDLHNRIIKLLISPFSVRENKTLKKMIKEQSNLRNIRYDEIAYHLPGKSIKAIKDQCVKLGLLSREDINLVPND